KTESASGVGGLGNIVQHSTELRTILQRSCTTNQLYAIDSLHGHAEMARRIAIHIRISKRVVSANVELPTAMRIESTRSNVDLINGAIHIINKHIGNLCED